MYDGFQKKLESVDPTFKSLIEIALNIFRRPRGKELEAISN